MNLINLALPAQSGILGLTEVFAPFLYLPLVLLIPLLFVRGFVLLRIAFACCLVVAALRFTPPLNFGPPQETTAVHFDLMTWNTFVENDPQNIINLLEQKPASVVVLQETSGEWLADDDTLKKLYPYQLRFMQGAPGGLVMLSSFPIINYSPYDSLNPNWQPGALLWAELELSPGKSVIVATAHPNSPDPGCISALCFEPAERNGEIDQIFGQVNEVLSQKKPFILAGDFNTTQYEQTYKKLTGSLQDTYLKVGLGWGSTWKPKQFNVNFPLLRLDYMLATPNITPLKMNVDCTEHGSDHCFMTGQFGIS